MKGQRDKRFCILYNEGKLGDEYHILIECATEKVILNRYKDSVQQFSIHRIQKGYRLWPDTSTLSQRWRWTPGRSDLFCLAIQYIFINIWFVIRRLNKCILYAKGLSNGMQATQSVKWNEMYKWNDDMKYPGFEPEQLGDQG